MSEKILDFLNRHLFWFILLALVASLPLSAAMLRRNSLQMVELRDKVIKIDQDTGDIAKIEPALLELRSYILTHMNAKMGGPLELVGSYNKAVEKERQRTASLDNTEGSLYRQAIAYCERTEMPLDLRAQCVSEYVLDRTPNGRTASSIQFPPKERFIYNWISPRWSPDAAGFSVLLSISLLGALVSVGLTRYAWPRVQSMVEDDPLE